MKSVLLNSIYYFLAFFLVLILNHAFFFLLSMNSEFKIGGQDPPLLYGAAGLSIVLAFLVNVKSNHRD